MNNPARVWPGVVIDLVAAREAAEKTVDEKEDDGSLPALSDVSSGSDSGHEGGAGAERAEGGGSSPSLGGGGEVVSCS